MDNVFGQVWEEIQDRVEAGIRINLLLRNITPTKELIEDELTKRMLVLVGKLCDLTLQED